MGIYSDDTVSIHYIGDDAANLNDVYQKDWHREDGPAYVAKALDGWVEKWYFNGEQHREGGPAYINVQPNSRVEIWKFEGNTHRQGAPATINYDKDGNVEAFFYYMYGYMHREDGPCCFIKESGYIRFYLYGNNHTKEALEFCEYHGIDYNNLSPEDKVILQIGSEKKWRLND